MMNPIRAIVDWVKWKYSFYRPLRLEEQTLREGLGGPWMPHDPLNIGYMVVLNGKRVELSRNQDWLRVVRIVQMSGKGQRWRTFWYLPKHLIERDLIVRRTEALKRLQDGRVTDEDLVLLRLKPAPVFCTNGRYGWAEEIERWSVADGIA